MQRIRDGVIDFPRSIIYTINEQTWLEERMTEPKIRQQKAEESKRLNNK